MFVRVWRMACEAFYIILSVFVFAWLWSVIRKSFYTTVSFIVAVIVFRWVRAHNFLGTDFGPILASATCFFLLLLASFYLEERTKEEGSQVDPAPSDEIPCVY